MAEGTEGEHTGKEEAEATGSGLVFGFGFHSSG